MDFQKEVIDKSREIPVVVDFWAPWCGPCKVLGPVLEELAGDNQGKWELVKVNSDEFPDLSAQFKIKGIPAVKMFDQGEVTAEFVGALPKVQIESWLEENIPDERKKVLKLLESQFSEGGEITSKIEDFVNQNPDLDEGWILLSKTQLFYHPDKAVESLKHVKSVHKYPEIQDLQNLIDFMTCELAESALDTKIKEARTASSEKNFDLALERLIEVVMVDKSLCDEMPRRAAIALFHLLGDQHEITRKHRRRFDMALY